VIITFITAATGSTLQPAAHVGTAPQQPRAPQTANNHQHQTHSSESFTSLPSIPITQQSIGASKSLVEYRTGPPLIAQRQRQLKKPTTAYPHL
jgi:hypothetical protein